MVSISTPCVLSARHSPVDSQFVLSSWAGRCRVTAIFAMGGEMISASAVAFSVRYIRTLLTYCMRQDDGVVIVRATPSPSPPTQIPRLPHSQATAYKRNYTERISDHQTSIYGRRTSIMTQKCFCHSSPASWEFRKLSAYYGLGWRY